MKIQGFTLAEGTSYCNLLPTKAKVGFTLAEVLITLGIIGVVAAMTIPTLIANYQKKQTVTKLQKAMSILNQAYRLAYDDVGEASPEEAMAMGSEAYFNRYWAPFIKTAHICKTYSECGYESSTPWKFKNNDTYNTGIVYLGNRVTFYTADGFVYIIFVAGGSASAGTYTHRSDIIVDLNGSKKPNEFGQDIFRFERIMDNDEKGGVVLPKGFSLSDEEIKNDCSKFSPTLKGSYCAEKIRRAGWQIDKSYPWN